jgi:hypothetical protein
VYGAADRRTGAVRLNLQHTCAPVIAWQRTGVFGPQALQGLVTIGHKLAHTRGVRSEAQAECRGAQAALRELERRRLPIADRTRARRWLRERHDTYFSAAYRLSNVGCRL